MNTNERLNMRKPNRTDYVYVHGFATRCYEVALEKGYTEEYARQMFLAGQILMLGYFFTKEEDKQLIITVNACKDLFGYQMKLTQQDVDIIDTARLTTYPVTGAKCDTYTYLSNIEHSCGRYSDKYEAELKLAKKLGLVKQDFRDENTELEEELKLNSNHVNAKIKAHILDDKTMEEIGFTEHRKGFLYFCRILDRELDISFSVTIPRDGSDIRIDVLDEAFCQPYDYQSILVNNPEHKTALRVQSKVEEWMEYLTEKGVLTGHIKGEYI